RGSPAGGWVDTGLGNHPAGRCLCQVCAAGGSQVVTVVCVTSKTANQGGRSCLCSVLWDMSVLSQLIKGSLTVRAEMCTVNSCAAVSSGEGGLHICAGNTTLFSAETWPGNTKESYS
uniref:Uncharacterized protein n=1 Tax=Serinus canaria TaxID=9135 RepID=A0A8C9NBA9_SERCA